MKMQWKLARKRLADVQPGDRVIDMNGSVSKVLEKTPERTPDDLYKITFTDSVGKVQTFCADASHIWPLDPDSMSVPGDHIGETEASTEDIAEWTARGYHPRLAHVVSPDGVVDGWIVKTCMLVNDDDAEVARVACLRVGSDTHTFLLASEDDHDEPHDADADERSVELTSVDGSRYAVSEHDYRAMMAGSAPTHNCGGTGSGKSVAERNVIFHVITHAKEIKILGIDLKRVELSAYKPYSNAVIGIATTLEDAVEVLRFAQETMMDRYGDMEAAHHNNFLDMENAGSALMVMIDEAGELLDMSSSAKALAASTLVPNREHRKDLGELQIGDHVIGEDGEWHQVLDKYEPRTDRAYEVTINRDCDGSRETFTAGGQHLWTVYINGDDPEVMDTDALMDLWEKTSEDQRGSIKFRRAASGQALDDSDLA
jgi:hypothetical protein